VTDNDYCLVEIIENDEGIIAAVQFEIKLFDFFSTSANSSLIIFMRTYTVNYRNALDRLRVRMNIILLFKSFIPSISNFLFIVPKHLARTCGSITLVDSQTFINICLQR